METSPEDLPDINIEARTIRALFEIASTRDAIGADLEKTKEDPYFAARASEWAGIVWRNTDTRLDGHSENYIVPGSVNWAYRLSSAAEIKMSKIIIDSIRLYELWGSHGSAGGRTGPFPYNDLTVSALRKVGELSRDQVFDRRVDQNRPQDAANCVIGLIVAAYGATNQYLLNLDASIESDKIDEQAAILTIYGANAYSPRSEDLKHIINGEIPRSKKEKAGEV